MNVLTVKSVKGFSLVELLIAMLISLVLVFACSSIYISLKQSLEVSQALSKAQESLRGSFYLMSRSAHQSAGYSIAAITVSGSSLTLSGAAPSIAAQDGKNVALQLVYGEPLNGIVYSCLGNPRQSDAVDTYYSDGEVLRCDDNYDGAVLKGEAVALAVSKFRLVELSDAGFEVIMNIKGIPEKQYTKNSGGTTITDPGFFFKLALRQKMLIKATAASVATGTGGA